MTYLFLVKFMKVIERKQCLATSLVKINGDCQIGFEKK